MSKEIQLLRPHDYEYVLEAYRKGEHMYERYGIGPDPKVVEATGRASCRICGLKIAKGIKAITWMWDAEGNSWTARDVYIHADGCPGVV